MDDICWYQLITLISEIAQGFGIGDVSFPSRKIVQKRRAQRGPPAASDLARLLKPDH